jgi:DNA-directed RNA polymerase specialized sigma24 family protein
MQPLEQSNKRAAAPRFADSSKDPNDPNGFRIYRLAFLLTGHREPSFDLTVDALDFQDESNPFFSTWMLAWSRRVFIAKALAAIRDELAASARRTASRRVEKHALPPRNWTLDRDMAKVGLESALLAIDVFPRCALLLSVFEGMPLEDVAILLDGEMDLVRKAQMIGLRDLTRNLARIQGWTSAATKSGVVTSEMQHA